MALTPGLLAANEHPVDASGFPATLTEPEAGAPLVMFIAGSGPTDRDGNSALGIRSFYLAKLAAGLARHSIGSLRFDKHGVPGSQPVPNEAEVTFDTFVGDAMSVLDWLNARFPGTPVLLLGHSEGGLVALAVAARRPDIAGLILVATPGRPLAETMRDQLQAFDEPLRTEALAIVGEIEADRETAEVPDALMPMFRPAVQPFMRSLLALRPAAILASLDMPAMVIGGGNDLQVGRADFDALAMAGTGIRLHWFDDMNHVLVDAPAKRAANVETYADPNTTLSEALVPAIAAFALNR